MKISLVTNYVAATFHPTIGQLAHQSLSNATTPELGRIPSRIRVNCRLTHSQGDTKTAGKHHWVYQAVHQSAKPMQPKGHPLHTHSKNPFTALVKEERQPEMIPKRKVRHSSSLQENSELVLALTWPKQLSCNPNQGTSAATNTQ